LSTVKPAQRAVYDGILAECQEERWAGTYRSSGKKVLYLCL